MENLIRCLAITLLCCCSNLQASTNLTLCNTGDETIYAAVVIKDIFDFYGDTWRIRGWTRIEPGTGWFYDGCETMYLSGATFYVGFRYAGVAGMTQFTGSQGQLEDTDKWFCVYPKGNYNEENLATEAIQNCQSPWALGIFSFRGYAGRFRVRQEESDKMDEELIIHIPTSKSHEHTPFRWSGQENRTGSTQDAEKSTKKRLNWVVLQHLERAKQGDMTSQYMLGLLYRTGASGVIKDDAQAAAWFRKAAEQGQKYAQRDLGELYEKGQGVKRDIGQAANWFLKAAEQDVSEAQFNIGMMYVRGEGVRRDDAKGMAWIRKAADNKYADAQYIIGIRHIVDAEDDIRIAHQDPEAKKRGWKKFDLARVWLRKAAEQGHAVAIDKLKKFDSPKCQSHEDFMECLSMF